MLAFLCAHGVQPGDVWQMTYGECAAIMAAIDRRETAEREQRAVFAWKTAEMVGQYMAYMLAKSAPRPQSLYKAFPWISKPEDDWRTLKARFSTKAEIYNALYAADEN